MICVCSTIIVISASYYSAVNRHGFVKIFIFRVTRKCTVHLALDGALCSAAGREIKCENTIDFVNDNLEWRNKGFCFVIMCSGSANSCKWLRIQYVLCIANNQ